ncbi:MAG: polysaccharide biosynthesis C-terminal domain-containing protein [Bacteroidales bacterium]|nr:polysaccharide biosynthesis C-terminal domain-containing protein [Bacteroidales bacterium]
MFKKILGTLGTRIINAALAFLAAILNTQYLGAENVGTIYLIILAVTIIQLFNNFVGGGALIYLTPRTPIYKLFVPAYAWTIGVTFISTFFLHLLRHISQNLNFIPDGSLYPILFLALIMSLASVNYMLLLGKEKVKTYNIINLLQVITLFLVLLMFLFVFRIRTVMAYYWAILGSFSLAFLLSLFALLPDLKPVAMTGMKKLLGEIFRYGTYVQFANIFQQLNYRLSLKFVDNFSGRAAVGVLSIGLTLAEGVWLISRSITMVQFSRLSNEMNFQYSVRLTLTFSKITLLVTTLLMLILLFIPTPAYIFVFGAQFRDLRMVVASLSIGIVTLSVSMMLSTFFSAINKPYHNTISSAIGLVFTIGMGLYLIPRWGLIGAGVAATCSYTCATLYQFVVFTRMTKLTSRDFLLSRSEIKLLFTELKKLSIKTPPSQD